MNATERATWLKERQSGIGGSDAAAIIGANPHKTALQVYREKTEPLGPELVNRAILRGRFLEPIIARIYKEQQGRIVTTPEAIVRDSEHPFLLASYDGIWFDGANDSGIVEFKAPGLRNFQKWKVEGVPQMYYVQLQHYLMVSGMRVGSFGIFSAERWELLPFDVPRDDQLIEQLRQAEIDFWTKHVALGIPPAEEATGPTIELPETTALVKHVPADLEPWTAALADWQEARELEELAAQNKERATEALKALMTSLPAEVAEGAGYRVYWQETKGRRTLDGSLISRRRLLDRDKLMERATKELPSSLLAPLVELADSAGVGIEEFKKQGAPSRPLKVYRLKAGSDDDE
jgi:putative phage-type endonuclease